MKTKTTPIEELEPGDKIYIPRSKLAPSKFPEVLTVKRINLKESLVHIEETGGLALKTKSFEKVIVPKPKAEPKPIQNDQLSFFDRL